MIVLVIMVVVFLRRRLVLGIPVLDFSVVTVIVIMAVVVRVAAFHFQQREHQTNAD